MNEFLSMLNPVAKWLHIIAGVMWIGLLYFFNFINGHVAATMDGDTTYPGDEIPRMVEMLENENLDFISCNRLQKMDKGAMSFSHRVGNWGLTFFTNLLHRIKIGDSQTGMWVFRREILDKINLTSDGMPLSEEIKIEAWKNKDIKCLEVPVRYHIRVGEVKLNTWNDGVKNLWFLFTKR